MYRVSRIINSIFRFFHQASTSLRCQYSKSSCMPFIGSCSSLEVSIAFYILPIYETM